MYAYFHSCVTRKLQIFFGTT